MADEDLIQEIGKKHGMSQDIIDSVKADTLAEAEQKRVDKKKAKKPDIPGLLHNSGPRLKSFLERVERLEAEKKALNEDVKDIYTEAKSTGFDPKIMRKIVALRKLPIEKRREESELLGLYMAAIGMAE